MATTTPSSRRGWMIGLVVLAFIALLAVIAVLAVNLMRATAGGVSFVADQVSDVAEGVSEAAGEVAVSGGQELNAEAFVRVEDQYVLRPSDFTVTYFVPQGGEKRVSNNSVVLDMGEYEGKTYITQTGRVDGWWIQLRRSNNAVVAPAIYESSIDVFETVEGAALALSPDWFWAYSDENTPTEFIDTSCGFGDQCIFFMYERFDPATRLTTLRYDIAFTYRNVLVWVSARGLDVEITEQDALDAAQLLFDRLSQYE